MFNRKTLFIVGAGAGADFKLPIGRDLARDIAKRTKLVLDYAGRVGEGSADRELTRSFFVQKRSHSLNEYFQAFNLIRNGILLTNSIDDFLNVHENSSAVVEVGKAAIVRSILYKERHSKLWVDTSNINNQLNVEAIHDSWLVRFMQVLAPGRKVPDVAKVFDDVTFINFNYDRCIEYFLIHALQLMYGVMLENARQIVKSASIIHPYGTVADLATVPFGGDQHHQYDYAGLAKSIKTYNERVEEQDVIDKMHFAIRRAECVVFLGFAYHKQNMKLLFDQLPKPKKTKHIFGTAFGMSEADKSEVVDELERIFPDVDDDDSVPSDSHIHRPALKRRNTSHIHVDAKLTCAKLFEDYAKSLAG